MYIENFWVYGHEVLEIVERHLVDMGYRCDRKRKIYDDEELNYDFLLCVGGGLEFEVKDMFELYGIEFKCDVISESKKYTLRHCISKYDLESMEYSYVGVKTVLEMVIDKFEKFYTRSVFGDCFKKSRIKFL